MGAVIPCYARGEVVDALLSAFRWWWRYGERRDSYEALDSVPHLAFLAYSVGRTAGAEVSGYFFRGVAMIVCACCVLFECWRDDGCINKNKIENCACLLVFFC